MTMSLVDNIMAFESGELSDHAMVEMFAGMIKDGTCWSLQGSYGRTATGLIDAGLISRAGEINHEKLDEILEQA